jgi:hypothetical protein
MEAQRYMHIGNQDVVVRSVKPMKISRYESSVQKGDESNDEYGSRNLA